MSRFLRSHLTYANVMATIAVFVALGGVSYAALELPRNSVTSAHVRDRSLRRADFKAGELLAAGASVVARVRSSAPVTVGGSPMRIPLEGATWDQAPGEFNLVFGTLTVRTTCPGGGSLMIRVYDNGRQINLPYITTPAVDQITVSFLPLFEPRSKVAHSLTVLANGSCTTAANDHTIERLDIAVVRVPYRSASST